ncbi:hypothetical protein N9L68_01710 [bacterium]|nr:hypothetical protein [bacterium]
MEVELHGSYRRERDGQAKRDVNTTTCENGVAEQMPAERGRTKVGAGSRDARLQAESGATQMRHGEDSLAEVLKYLNGIGNKDLKRFVPERSVRRLPRGLIDKKISMPVRDEGRMCGSFGQTMADIERPVERIADLRHLMAALIEFIDMKDVEIPAMQVQLGYGISINLEILYESEQGDIIQRNDLVANEFKEKLKRDAGRSFWRVRCVSTETALNVGKTNTTTERGRAPEAIIPGGLRTCCPERRTSAMQISHLTAVGHASGRMMIPNHSTRSPAGG